MSAGPTCGFETGAMVLRAGHALVAVPPAEAAEVVGQTAPAENLGMAASARRRRPTSELVGAGLPPFAGPPEPRVKASRVLQAPADRRPVEACAANSQGVRFPSELRGRLRL